MLKIRILSLFLLMLYAAPSLAEIKLSKYPKVYKGEEGLKVIFVGLSPKSKKQALIQVSGIDTQIDGNVFLYDMAKQGRNKTAYQMKFNGSTVTRLSAKEGYWQKSTTVYLPDSRKGKTIWYDEKESKKVDTNSLLAIYKRDKKLQTKLAKYDRKKDVVYNKEKIQEMIESTKSDCGKKISIVSNLNKVSDSILKEYSVYSFCGQPLEELARYCRKSAANKKVVAEKINKIVCKNGTKLKARLKNKTLYWDWEVETGNQNDFVAAFLNNNL